MVDCNTDFDGARLNTAGSSIPYKLLDQGATFEENSASAFEVILIRASDIAAFIAESFPPPTIINNTFLAPGKIRTMPGNNYLWTKRVELENFDDQLPIDIWDYDNNAPNGTYNDRVRLRISYETRDDTSKIDPAKPETFLRHSINAGGEFLMIPPKGTNWVAPPGTTSSEAGDNKDFNVPATKIIPTIEHTLDWSYVINPPWTAIRTQLGTLNDAVLKLFDDAAIDTVLFMSLSGEQKYTTTGALPWSLSYKFSERNVTQDGESLGWNYVYNPSANIFMKLNRINPDDPENPIPLYSSSDFKELFKTEDPDDD